MALQPQFTVRLDARHRAAVADLRQRLATPLLPEVTTADVLRAGIMALYASVLAAPTSGSHGSAA